MHKGGIFPPSFFAQISRLGMAFAISNPCDNDKASVGDTCSTSALMERLKMKNACGLSPFFSKKSLFDVEMGRFVKYRTYHAASIGRRLAYTRPHLYG